MATMQDDQEQDEEEMLDFDLRIARYENLIDRQVCYTHPSFPSLLFIPFYPILFSSLPFDCHRLIC